MTAISKEYAEAIFSIAKETKAISLYADAFVSLRTLLAENPAYTEFLSSPALPLSERLAAIDEAFAASLPEPMVSFLKLLCERGRIGELEDCIRAFEALKLADERRTTAKILSAAPLTEAQKQALCQKLEAVSGKQIDPVYIVDPALLGGVKVEMEENTLDGSTAARLRDVKEVMNR